MGLYFTILLNWMFKLLPLYLVKTGLLLKDNRVRLRNMFITYT